MTEERDAHLREALRHAPDAQVQPPPALSRFILDEARAKARDAAAPPRPQSSAWSALTRLWHWLARPSVATGFAGVMAATLVGMMWWGRPMDEALPPRPAPEAATVPAPVPPAAPVEDMRAQKEAPHAALRKPPPMAAKPQPKAQAEAQPQAKKEDQALSAPAAPVPAPAPAPAAATPSVPRVAAAPPQPTGGAAPAGVAADAAEPVRSRAAEARRAKVAEAFSPSKLAEAPASIAALRADIASAPARWTWQRPGEAAQPMNDAVYAWLAQLDTVAGNRWLPRQARETTPPLGRELRLLRDGRVQHSLQLSEGAVLWEREQASWQVTLPLSTLQTLEATAP
ncbi:hypothetical protein ACVNIS_00025 [Sphaerotilaceae bacterium SBD11-9]